MIDNEFRPLSKSEVAAYCRTPQKARQVAFLVANGIKHHVDAHGWPVVLARSLEGGRGSARPQDGVWKPRKSA